jgi:hypothetical protein
MGAPSVDGGRAGPFPRPVPVLNLSGDGAGRGRLGDDGERLVAEVGQQVYRLADDAPGLGQAGPVGVDAFPHGGVVAVAGAPPRAEVLAASNSSQRSISGPWRDSRAGTRGAAFVVGGVHGDVQADEADRPPGGGEPVGAAQPGAQRQGGHRPHAVDLVHEHAGAVCVPGGGQQPFAEPVQVLVQGPASRSGRC